MKCDECKKVCKYNDGDILNCPCVYCKYESKAVVNSICSKCIEKECQFEEK